MTVLTPLPPATPAPAASLPPAERLAVVDILRGFALFGILVVNMGLFKAPVSIESAAATSVSAPLDRLAGYAIDALAEGKFFTLFSFLFGLGFAIQLQRAERAGQPAVPRFVRRLLVLLPIGLAHAILLWYGDILASYALLGLLLIPFRHRAPRTLLLWAVGLLLGLTLVSGLGMVAIETLRADPAAGPAIVAAEGEALAAARADAAQQLALYRDGRYLDLVGARLGVPQGMIFIMITQSLPIMAMFLLGLYAGRQGILANSAGHRPLLRRVRTIGLTLGLLAAGLVVLAETQLSLFAGLLGSLFLNHALAGPLLALGYAASLALLVERARWRRWLSPLAAAGRLALSNYLLQSLIATTLFYGYGFGLFGRVGVATGLLLTVVIYAVQLVVSHWYLRHFQIGPAEWLWRTLTDGQPRPWRRAAPTVGDRGGV